MKNNLIISKMYLKLFASLSKLNANIQKDKKTFIQFGVEKERLAVFQDKIQKYGVAVQDNFTELGLKEKNTQRILVRKLLREKIRIVLCSMMFMWPEKHPMAKFYQIPDLRKLNDFELANTGRIILLVAHKHKKVLKNQGLRDEQLYQLSTVIAKLTVKHTESALLKKELNIRNAMLKQFSVELIQEAKIYAKIGRAIWCENSKNQCINYRIPYKIYKKILEADVGYSTITNPY